MKSSVPTPNYVLTEAHRVPGEFGSERVLEAGSFVRPIEYHYVPKHILEGQEGRYFSKSTEVFVYTRYGIVAVPKKIVRRA